MARFLHTGDWQLGMTRHFLSGEAQGRFTDDRFEAVREILELASREACACVVVCGDVFETNQVTRQTVLRALDLLRGSAVPVVLLPGNHDPLDAASVFRSRAFKEHCPAQVRVIQNSEPFTVGPGLEIVGAPWTSKRPLGDLVVAAAPQNAPLPGTVRVLVGHGALDTLSPDRDNLAAISLSGVEAALREGRAHYVALGDRHSLSSAGSTGRVRYAGTPEATDYDETDPGQVLVVEVDETGCRTRAHRVGRWRFLREEFELAGDGDLDLMVERLAALESKERTILKVTLRGTLTLRQRARLDEILSHAQELLAALELWERTSELVVRPDDGDFADLGLSGFAEAAATRLRALAAGPEPEATEARDALGLLLRLARRPA